jgi:AmpD protein
VDPDPVDSGGLLAEAGQIPSQNCDERPDDEPVTLLVVHNISLPPGELGGDAVIQFFANSLDFSAHPYFDCLRGLRVSPHFLIRRGGELVQFVPCAMRAWHAGVSIWRGRERCNDFSVGVELEGADDLEYTELQYRRLASLTADLLDKYPIVDVVGHSDIAPGRKTDPGPSFEWARYRFALARIMHSARRR